MFGPMFGGDGASQAILFGIAFVLFIVGMLWIYRITKDIEDN